MSSTNDASTPSAADSVSPVDVNLAAAADASGRPEYRYSVIPGGAYSREELAGAIERDPVVAEHYRAVNLPSMRVETLAAPRSVYVSYRRNNRIYWTNRRVTLNKGETILTDGVTTIRARCGNCISQTAMTPTAGEEPPVADLDRVETPGHAVAAPALLAMAEPGAAPGDGPAFLSGAPGGSPGGFAGGGGGGVGPHGGVGGVGGGGGGGGAAGGGGATSPGTRSENSLDHGGTGTDVVNEGNKGGDSFPGPVKPAPANPLPDVSTPGGPPADVTSPRPDNPGGGGGNTPGGPGNHPGGPGDHPGGPGNHPGGDIPGGPGDHPGGPGDNPGGPNDGGPGDNPGGPGDDPGGDDPGGPGDNPGGPGDQPDDPRGDPKPIPEPATLLLIGTGVSMAALRRRLQQSNRGE